MHWSEKLSTVALDLLEELLTTIINEKHLGSQDYAIE